MLGNCTRLQSHVICQREMQLGMHCSVPQAGDIPESPSMHQACPLLGMCGISVDSKPYW